jgi:N12 class adenine-specific DNA methylase
MLYQPLPKEAEKQTEHKEERETLNLLYDAFVKKYGNLNAADNAKLIKTDSAGKKSLSGACHWRRNTQSGYIQPSC